MQASVLTLVRGRETHLRKLMEGLAAQMRKPAELVIAWMQEAPHADLPDPGCPVVHVFCPGEPMPLAAARNRAAEAARAPLLVFLDVDCIPSPGLVAAYEGAADAHAGLFLGEVLYLPAGATDGAGLDFAALDRVGVVHPSKPPIPEEGVRREPDSGELWGLSFAIARDEWMQLGGMDEGFVGYGGEETDFAARVCGADLPVFWTAGARAYHQHHTVHVPPLHQFDHILRNAARFHERHGRWCMNYWLGQFRDRGLIEWSEGADVISVLREPQPEEIAAARQPGTRLFS